MSDDGAMPGRLVKWMGIALFIAVAGGMALYLSRREPAEADQSASVISAFISLVALALTIYGQYAERRARPAPANAEEGLAAAKKLLATRVFEQWSTEATIRFLDNPGPIPIFWHLVGDSGLMDHPHLVGDHLLTFSGSSSKASELARAFRRLHRRRLVITGGPGTGKTTLAMQLLLELVAADRDPADPVPMLMPVYGWDTSKHPRLQDWVATRLATDYPELNAPAYGNDAARALAMHGHVLPVLDGLDEMPKPARVAVISTLNRWLASGDQYILTSRTTEFAAAVDQAGEVLRAAAVIAPATITAEVAENHLRDCLPRVPRHDWTPIWSALRDGSSPSLSRVTETALGLWLIHAVYIPPETDPADLVDTDRFPTSGTLRAHLFDALIPNLLKARETVEPHRPLQDPDKVRQWLSYLAHHLTHHSGDGDDGRRDFAWWRLAATTGTMTLTTRLALAAAATLAAGLMLGLAFGLVDWAEDAYLTEKEQYLSEFPLALLGLAVGAMVGGYLGRNAGFWAEDGPGYADLRIRRRLATLVGRFLRYFAFGLMGGLSLWLIGSLMDGMPIDVAGIFAWFGIATALMIWLAVEIPQWADTPPPSSPIVTPIDSWRANRVLNLLRVSISVFAGGLWPLLISLGPASGGERLDPWMAALVWFTQSLAYALASALTFGIAGRHRAWWAYLVASGKLAWAGHLPRRLMPFLDDCHRLGLLRAVGPIYQFRHAELQDHLAAGHRPPS
ncbi:NACHT domain-containing protein [Nonomuraea sp. NPDC049421]|uniref:NACHT domain-containing protein n=1 Tax=Nonomuraea sp. NPDC049421 TaxID=3155275 RepID=UPI003439F9FD